MNTRSYVKATADALHQDFVNTILSAKESGSATGQELFCDHLKSIHADATDLINNFSNYLNPINAGQLKHIVGRPVDEHINVIKSRTKNLIGTF